MQRRTIRAIGAGVAIAALGLMGLTACSSAASSNEKVTLTYGIWDKNQEPAMQQIVSAFEKQNPNITVNIELTPNADYWTKLQTAASAGTAPDVFWMNGPNFQLYASNGQLAPLDNVKTSDYPKALDRPVHLPGQDRTGRRRTSTRSASGTTRSSSTQRASPTRRPAGPGMTSRPTRRR